MPSLMKNLLEDLFLKKHQHFKNKIFFHEKKKSKISAFHLNFFKEIQE
jgi:hypothetical protein